MNTLLLRTLELKKTPSLQTFAQYKEAESQHSRHSSVTNEGELLEHQTLELRVHPPNVSVLSDTHQHQLASSCAAQHAAAACDPAHAPGRHRQQTGAAHQHGRPAGSVLGCRAAPEGHYQ